MSYETIYEDNITEEEGLLIAKTLCLPFDFIDVEFSVNVKYDYCPGARGTYWEPEEFPEVDVCDYTNFVLEDFHLSKKQTDKIIDILISTRGEAFEIVCFEDADARAEEWWDQGL